MTFQLNSSRARQLAGVALVGLMMGAAPALATPFSGGASSGGAIEGGEGAPGGGVGVPGAVINNVRIADDASVGDSPWSVGLDSRAATARAYYPIDGLPRRHRSK